MSEAKSFVESDLRRAAVFDGVHMLTFEVEIRCNDGTLSAMAYVRFYTMAAAKASVEAWIDKKNYRVSAIREMGHRVS